MDVGTIEGLIEGPHADIIDAGGDFVGRYHRRRYRSARGYRPSWDSQFDTYDPGHDDYIPYSMVGGAFYGVSKLEDWRLRGKQARDYYKNTGYNPRYYNKFTRRRTKW